MLIEAPGCPHVSAAPVFRAMTTPDFSESSAASSYEAFRLASLLTTQERARVGVPGDRKELVVHIHHDEGLSTHIMQATPRRRERGGEASAGSERTDH